MKKIFTILLTLILIFTSNLAYCEATPTDLSPAEVNAQWGDRKIELYFIKSPEYLGDNVILSFKLINYPPGEIETIEWQESTNNKDWETIEGADQMTYEFIIDRTNYDHWWRVQVSYKIII